MAASRFAPGDHGVDSYGIDDNGAFEVENIVDGIGLPLEHQREQAPDFVPKHAWKWIDTPENTKATIDVAIGEEWDFARREMAFIRNKMQEKMGTARPKPEAIFDLVCGPQSNIYKTLDSANIFQSIDDYCQLLSTFFISSAYQVSTKQLFDKHSRINLDGCMGKEQHLDHWHRIGESGLPPRLERNRSTTPTGVKPLWMKVEESYNDFCRDTFVDGFPGKMQTTCDDDKAHVQGMNYTAGLKLMKHTNDNTNGHTLHTLVYSFSQVPIQITWERAVNDNSEKAAKRLYHSAITPMAASHGDLRNVGTGQDRGYCGVHSLHDHAIRTGLEIKGATVKRQMSLAFNYAQDQPKNDPRTKIPVSGPKTLFTKCCTSYGRTLYNHAYRDGKGHVILGLSTVYGAVPEWELAVAKPQDMVWYQDKALTRRDKIPFSFKGVKTMANPALKREETYSELSKDFLAAVDGLPVNALTTTQGSPDWFMMRKFALTLSTTDTAIASCDGKESWIEDKKPWETIKRIIGKQQVKVEEQTEEEDEEEDDNRVNNKSTEAAAVNEEASANNNPIPLSLESLLIDEDAVQCAKDQIAFSECDIKQVRAVLTQLGKALSKAASNIKKEENNWKSFKLFLETDSRFRRYVFAGKKELQCIAKELDIAADGDAKTLCVSIKNHLAANPDAAIGAGEKKKESAKTKARRKAAVLGDRQKTIHSILRASYLDPLKGKAKKYTRTGHIPEMHLMRQCINEHTDPALHSPLRLAKACTAPLTEKQGKRFARDSIDFIGLTTEGNPIGVEVKARVSLKRDQAEQEHVAEIRRMVGQD